MDESIPDKREFCPSCGHEHGWDDYCGYGDWDDQCDCDEQPSGPESEPTTERGEA